jgi:hypothetical protein
MNESDQQRVLAAFYKPVAGGYVFRAPSGWRLWRRQHFVVDTALRDRLIALANEPGWVVVLWIAIPWLVVSFAGVGALAWHFGDTPGHSLEMVVGGLVAAIAGLFAGLAALSEHEWRRALPLLRGARPTNERISPQEMAAAVRAAGGPTRRSMLTQILSGAVLLAAGMLSVGLWIGTVGRSGAWAQLISGAAMSVSGFALIFIAARNLANKQD